MLRHLRSLVWVGRRDPALFLLALHVGVLLTLTRGIIRILPMRSITRFLGTAMQESPVDGLNPDELRYVRRVRWTIEKLAPHTPTESNCYPQALTARWLLHRRGISSTVYYGATFEPGRPSLEGHVWMRSGHLIVTGGASSSRYTPLSYFADDPGGSPRCVCSRWRWRQ